jgi:hypothetical protein
LVWPPFHVKFFAKREAHQMSDHDVLTLLELGGLRRFHRHR